MFFIASKLLWFVLSPLNLALILLTAAMLAMQRRFMRAARFLGIASWIVLVIFAVLPTGPYLIHRLENQAAKPDPMPRRVAGIIALGGAIEGDLGRSRGAPQVNAASDRIAAFVALAQQYPWAKIVYTGGIGNLDGSGTPEGDMIRDILAGYNFHPNQRLLIENQSRSTAENAALTKALVAPKPDDVYILVTSAWHMPRALGAFRAQGWNVVPYPADYLTPPATIKPTSFIANLEQSHLAIKEYLGILAYSLTGKWTKAASDNL